MMKRPSNNIFFKWILLILIIFVFSAESWAGALRQIEFERHAADQVKLLLNVDTENIASLPSRQREACTERYEEILADGVLDIRIALGYEDMTIGADYIYRGVNYGLSPSVDIGEYKSFKNALLQPCVGLAQFCGFMEEPQNPNLLTKNVVIHGRPARARVEIRQTSMSDYLLHNTQSFAAEQKRKSESMDRFFADALQKADAIFYRGHSRKGGGPDFWAPIFKNGVNAIAYDDHYRKYYPGLQKMISALSKNNKASIVGLFSCQSRNHFLKAIQRVAPQVGVISTLANIQTLPAHRAVIGATDALLRGQCYNGLLQELRMTPETAKLLTMDGVF